MDWLQSMQNSIDYIERNILSDIDYEEIAKCAYSSTYHFLRMFSMLTGFTVGEYIRNRRLSLAAQELSMSNARVTDIAFKYGYDTSEAFSKAFQRLHGVTPSAAREPGVQLKSFGRLSIRIIMKGDKEMSYKIIKNEAFSIFGKTIGITASNAFDIVPRFWDDLEKQGFFGKACLAAGYETQFPQIAATHDFQDGGSRKYTLAYMLPAEKDLSKAFDVVQIPKLEWVIVTEKCDVAGGSASLIQNMWDRLFSEWFPTSDYEVTPGPQLERYYHDKLEVWVPVRKK